MSAGEHLGDVVPTAGLGDAEAEDLINIGAYNRGSNPKIDYAISKIDEINAFLRQNFDETSTLKQTLEQLGGLLSDRKEEDRAPKNRRGTDR